MSCQAELVEAGMLRCNPPSIALRLAQYRLKIFKN
jgi:hypothetical protein